MSFEVAVAGLARKGIPQPAQPGFSVASMVLPPPELPRDEVSAVLKALRTLVLLRISTGLASLLRRTLLSAATS